MTNLNYKPQNNSALPEGIYRAGFYAKTAAMTPPVNLPQPPQPAQPAQPVQPNENMWKAAPRSNVPQAQTPLVRQSTQGRGTIPQAQVPTRTQGGPAPVMQPPRSAPPQQSMFPTLAGLGGLAAGAGAAAYQGIQQLPSAMTFANIGAADINRRTAPMQQTVSGALTPPPQEPMPWKKDERSWLRFALDGFDTPDDPYADTTARRFWWNNLATPTEKADLWKQRNADTEVLDRKKIMEQYYNMRTQDQTKMNDAYKKWQEARQNYMSTGDKTPGGASQTPFYNYQVMNRLY